MKKYLFFLMLSCLLAVSCAKDDKYEGYYITYDEVEVREQPSEDAPAVLKLICINRPGSYKKAEGDVPCAFVADNNGPSPIGVKQIDESGKWGYIDESIPLILHWKGWIPLDKMIPCGTQEDDEVVPVYEVCEDGLEMYRHPEENSKDKVLAYNIKKGDKVQLRASKGGWSFVSWMFCSDSGEELEKFGWVPTKSLAQVEAVSRGKIKEEVYGKMLEKTQDKRVGINTITILRKIFLGACILSLLFTLVFLIPGIRRKLWLASLVWMPGFTIFLFMGYYLTGAPALVYALLIVLAAYTLTYPLRYRRRASGYSLPFWILSVGGSLVALVFLKFFSGGHLIGNILAVAFDMVVVVLLTSWITAKVEHYICPHCDFYAGHPRIRVDDGGETVAHGTESWDEFDHSSTRTNWLGERIKTNYYKRHYETVVYIVHHYTIVRKCLGCGKEILEHKTSTRKPTASERARIENGTF